MDSMLLAVIYLAFVSLGLPFYLLAFAALNVGFLERAYIEVWQSEDK